MMVVGLTGSIAMGKSETAKLFAGLGIPVFDSDADVHRQYSKGGEAVIAVQAIFPEAVVEGQVDRRRLSQMVLADPAAMQRLEEIVHPIVKKHEEQFLQRCQQEGHPIAVLDIPLLFETRREKDVDCVVVVSAPLGMQRQRALERPEMTLEKLDRILKCQVPDPEQRRRANFVVDTSQGSEHALAQVRQIVVRLKSTNRDRQL